MDRANRTTASDGGGGQPTRQAADRRRSASRDPRVFVLLRELSEVHLLLDNVSANPDTTVAELIDQEKLEKQGLKKDWIEEICQISWPPDGSNEEKAEDAALLIRAKDYLNRLTRPASGATIAFTHLVTQEARIKPGLLGRLFSRASGAEPDDGPVGGETADEQRRATRNAATRQSLAETAYPDLVGKAASFRKAMWFISIGLLIALLITCALSWFVAYGNAGLAELAAARQAVAETQARINEAETTETAQQERQERGQPAPAVQPSAPATFTRYCQRDPITSATQAQLCEALRRAEADRIAAEERVTRWVCIDFVGNCDGRIKDGPSRASALANIMGSAVLPFLYGLLGAGAAIIRSLSRKIRLSLLSPRDLQLSFQQLALGAVIGACIGLFVVAPGSDATGDGLLGPVALSASAVSFIAGFGVDAVFQALESLIGRIFNVRQPGAAAANGTSTH